MSHCTPPPIDSPELRMRLFVPRHTDGCWLVGWLVSWVFPTAIGDTIDCCTQHHGSQVTTYVYLVIRRPVTHATLALSSGLD
ncbi:hypothetical protein M434DRAFT_360400 [Hypoxylon sp. CO27-5]|nr:hypothetical protein M434DRAFT_360400 [Hypoxylon sp. CO27-5]